MSCDEDVDGYTVNHLQHLSLTEKNVELKKAPFVKELQEALFLCYFAIYMKNHSAYA